MLTALTQIFRSLAIRNYRIWSIGSVCSNIGTWMQFTAQDWIVLTVMTHGDATAVGVVMALQLMPPLVFLPWTGHVADRFDRRALLMGTQVAMGVLALALGTLLLVGCAHLWEVDLFALVSGTVAAFDAPARHTFVGELVGDEHLPNAVGLNSMSFNVGRLVGPALGGFCVAAVGPGWAFMVNGVSFLGVFCALQALRVRDFYPMITREKRLDSGLWSGVRYVWARPDLRIVMVMLALVGTFGFNFPIFISTMAVQVFHLGAHGYGLLTSAMAVGTLLGAAIAAARSDSTLATLPLRAGAFAVGCGVAAVAPDQIVFALALVMLGAASLTFTTTTSSLIQLSSDPGMRGRVIAIRLAVFAGGTPIGAPAVGWVANHFGPRWALGVGALAGVISALVAAVFLLRRQRNPAREAR